MAKNYKQQILRMIIAQEYLQYCTASKEKKYLFEHNGELIRARDALKILKAFGKSEDTNGWAKYIHKISKLAKADTEFIEELMQDRCEECGGTNMIEEKLSRRHPEWISSQRNFGKEFGKQKWYLGVFKHTCQDCGFFEYYCTGVDKNPDEGLDE